MGSVRSTGMGQFSATDSAPPIQHRRFSASQFSAADSAPADSALANSAKADSAPASMFLI
ncbi:Hypothetical protein FKW44_018285 [Caligus rogercresseyi]|uniref:Uncharacterized protein n=1 Tax=Caligus rogercresseyi TaxID=217165 RepID=A0A7T8JXB1_CALRO|nr:Hypothetical protein FKW44_018285 [Caligus rogercresseyi]